MPARARQQGFTYIGLIMLVAIIGLTGAATVKFNSLQQRVLAEEELLDIGAAFSDALRSYAAASQPGQMQQPPTLQDLLLDPRFPGVRRHLRKVFVDPMTGKAEWGIQYLNGESGVIAVYSLSTARPFKIGNFDARFRGFEDKRKISDWKFTLDGQAAMMPPPGSPPAALEPLVPPAVPVAAPVAPQAPPPVNEAVPEPEPEPEPVPMPEPEPVPPTEPEPAPEAEPVPEPPSDPVPEPVTEPASEPASTTPPPSPPPTPGKGKRRN